MKIFNIGDASPSARMTFLSIGVVVFIANYLAGFDNISWSFAALVLSCFRMLRRGIGPALVSRSSTVKFDKFSFPSKVFSTGTFVGTGPTGTNNKCHKCLKERHIYRYLYIARHVTQYIILNITLDFIFSFSRFQHHLQFQVQTIYYFLMF